MRQYSSLFVLLITTVTFLARGQEFSCKSITAEATSAWRDVFDNRLVGHYHERFRAKGSSEVDPLDFERDTWATENSVKAIRRDFLEGGRVSVFVNNPDYTFEAARDEEHGEFVLKKLIVRESGSPVPNEALAARIDRLRQLPAPRFFMYMDWDDLFASAGLEARSCKPTQWNGNDAITIDFEFDPRKHDPTQAFPADFEVRDARVVLLPQHDWMPVEWSFRVRDYKYEKEFLQVKSTAEYDFKSHRFPLLVRHVQDRVYKGESDTETREFTYRRLDRPVPPREFRLSRFGLPEPPGLQPRPWIPVWIWPVLFAIACVVLGYWLLRDR